MSDLAIVVFSKDRPLQLDATLRSLESNCVDVEPTDIRVLYAASLPAYSTWYRVLGTEHPGVTFLRESDFRSDLIRLVENSKHVMFLVDDTLFVGQTSVSKAGRLLERDDSYLGFSFRLGRNTTFCYSHDKPQRVPMLEDLGSGTVAFDWTDAEDDFGYPLEVSSSMYRTKDVLPLLETLEYRNPNTLESVLAQHARAFREQRPRLACHEQSVAFSVPANLVQSVWLNRVASNPDLSTEALMDAYARGKRVEVERYRGFVPNACHQEIELVFTQRLDVPTVSVVIPCYGQAAYLPGAVASVLSQSFIDWELVIVDDGSLDDTAAVAQRLIDGHGEQRIRLLRQQNGGLARARNAGIAASKGRYILPLDADDELAPEMLLATVEVLEADRTMSIAYTDWERFGSVTDRPSMQEFNPLTLPARNQFGYCALYRREVWEAVGGYNPALAHGYEDWDFWVGAVENRFVARRVPKPLFRYRVRPGSMYEMALRHDTELRSQIAANHPRLYRAWQRAIRSAVLAMGDLWHLIRRALGRSPIGEPLRDLRELWRRRGSAG